MFKRMMLTLTFVAAFGTLGFGVASQADAWRGGYYGRPYGAYYAPRTAYFGPTVVPYRAYYGPRIVRPYYPTYYAPPAYPVYYGGYYASPGVTFSVGF